MSRYEQYVDMYEASDPIQDDRVADADGWRYVYPRYTGDGPSHVTLEDFEVQYISSYTGDWEGITRKTGRPAWFDTDKYRYRPRQDGPETQGDLFGTPSTLDATIGNSEPSVDDLRQVSLPDGDADRLDYPMFDGLIAYFPNALAEISRLSKIGNEQHNPGEPMHWARDKSTDHGNKIIRHQVDAGKLDSKGNRHSTSVAWRALAQLQEELERDLGLPPSPASRNRPW